MEKTIKMDDLGVPLFLETPIYETYKTNKRFSMSNCAGFLPL